MVRNIIIGVFLTLLTCGQIIGQSATETAWLNQRITPVQSMQAGSSFADLAPVADLVTGARVVGLGECTHGSHEVFELKHRLLEYLVTQQGFTTFAIEADYGWGEILNEYIQTGKGDSLTVHSALGFEVWNTTEFWDMVEWMRTYNQQHAVKLRYVGIDMQDPYPNLFRLKHFADQQADTVLRRLVRDLRDDCFANQKAPNKTTVVTKRRMMQLSDELARHLQTIGAPTTMQQHGQVLVQRAHLTQQDGHSPVRDEAMAANVVWALQQDSAAKVVVWAHNEHVQKQETAEKSMGHYLAQRLGPAYVALGFATGTGTASIFRADGMFLTTTLQPPVPKSAEWWFEQANTPNFLLTLQGIDEPAGRWLTERKLFRVIGSRGSAKQFREHQPLSELYDALIYLHQTSASHSYRSAQEIKQ